MAVPSLGQITRELNNVYNPQVKLLQDKQAAIPGQIQSEETGLQAKQTQAFDDILGGARRRGLGFAGIPLQEQAKYTSTEFLPALARLRQQGNEQRMGLEEAILGVRERQNNMAYQTREGILSREMAMRQLREQQRQFNESQRAAARASAGGGGGGFMPTLGGLQPQAQPKPAMTRKKDGGFAFKDPNGNSISAAAYAAGTGMQFRQLLQKMASAGDKGAKQALGFVGDDFGFDPGKIGNNRGLYNALTWGLK